MGVGGGSIDAIRKLFRKSSYHQAPYIPAAGYAGYSGLGSYNGGFGFDYLNTTSSIFGIQDYIRIEQDLISRYVDYEDQDESPLISSALDIYSDDASQTDTMNGHSIWVEADDEDIRADLNHLLHNTLRVEEKIWGELRTLNKYGNMANEIVARDQSGVLALNMLPPPTFRRIEVPAEIGKFMNRMNDSPDTVGYIYDPKGVFKISTREFMNELTYKVTGQGDPNRQIPNTAVFENWEVCHMRLLGKNPSSMYGNGIGEPARWLYKRLVLLEDSVILHRLCLRGDTNVWTTSGYKKIKDLSEGEEVYSFGKDKSLHKTKVIYKKHNGRDKIYKISSRHRELYANATHPVLVEIVNRHGSGKPITRDMVYVEVQNLIPGVHRFVEPSVGDEHCEKVKLEKPDVARKARLKGDHLDPYLGDGIFANSKEFGVESGRLKRFCVGDYWLPLATALRVVVGLGAGEDDLEIVEDWGGLRQANIPEFVTSDFARLFGFMLGDGYLALSRMKGDYFSKRVGLSLGNDEETNEKYIGLFDKFFGKASLSQKKHLDYPNSYTAGSIPLYDFFIMNGFIPGAENKRIPSWVFKASKEIKLEFIEGIVDADGHRKESRSAGIRDMPTSKSVTMEMCNKELLEDLRELCMQCGLSVGASITSRSRHFGRRILDGKPLAATTSYTLHFSFNTHYDDRLIVSVEQVEDDDIWDIGVESDEHNFVANGVVVHNTRSPSRYAFYIDVSAIPPQETGAYLNRVKQSLKKSKFVNPMNNKLDLRYQPMTPDDDFFMPVRDGKESTRVESMAGPIYDAIEDIKYFEAKLFAALKVPKPFLTYEESTAKTNLSAEDARFARTVMRIQREYKNGYRKVCEVHLSARGIDPKSVNFSVEMTIPSAIFELAQLEIRAAELDLAEKFDAYAPREWIMKEVLGFSEDQIEEMEAMKKREEERGLPQPKSASGGIAKMTSQRGQRAPAPESVRKKKNTTSLMERIEERRYYDPAFNQRWTRMEGAIKDIQHCLKSRPQSK